MHYITEFKQLPLDSIEPSDHHTNIHFSDKKIELVAQNIKKKGLMDPLLVAKTPDGQKYKIILGIKRYLAFKKLSYTTVVAGIINEVISTTEAWALALRYPSLSELLTDIDKSKAIKYLLDNNDVNLTQVSDQTGIKISDLKRYLTIFEFDEQLTEMLKNGEISLKTSVLSHKLKQSLSKLTENQLSSDTSSKIGKKLVTHNFDSIQQLEQIIEILE